MNVTIQSVPINKYNSESYITVDIPYDSTIKTCYVYDGYLYYVIESPFGIQPNKKCTFFIKSNTSTSYLPDNYIYLDRQTVYESTLINNSSSNGINISISDIIINYIFYVLIEKTKEEERTLKINEIVNE
jgi:hypothetical protein